MDDPVVQEIDVYLSKQLKDHLYLFQFPVRSSNMNYDEVEHISARVKPRQRKIELEIAIDTDGPCYNHRKGVDIARNVDGNNRGASSYYSSDAMDKQLLSSVGVSCDASRYVIGAIHNGELHLSPLEAIVQLRPSFNYLDSADIKAEVAKAQQGAERAAATESSQDEDEAKPLVAKYQRHETDEAKVRRTLSYEHMRSTNDKEAWVKLYHHSMSQLRSQQEQSLLYAKDNAQQNSEFCMPGEEYLQKVLTKVDSDTQSRDSSLRDIRRLPLPDQIKAILINVKVIRLSSLLELLAGNFNAADVLQFVEQVAMLVQGCWVVKSLIIYPEGTFSSYDRKLSSEVLCNVRDYVMWRFTLSHSITRRELAGIVKLPSEDELMILEQLAVHSGRRGWQFKLDCDTEFILQHPNIVGRQMQKWEAKSNHLCSVLRVDKQLIPVSAGVTRSPQKSKRRSTSGNRLRSPTRRTSKLSETSTAEASEDIGNSSLDLINHVSTSFLESMAKGDIEDLGDLEHILNSDQPVEMEDLNNVSSATANHITAAATNGYQPTDDSRFRRGEFEGTVINPELKSAVDEFILDNLRDRHVVCVNEAKALLSMKVATLSPGHILGTGVSDFLLEQSLNENGVRMQVRSSQGEMVYVNRRANDGLDYIRDALLELLNIRPVVRITVLKKKLENCGNIKDDDLKKVLKEYCFTSGGSWHLKCVKDKS